MLKKIIQNLETGNYRIEYREKCNCNFYWDTNKNGDLVCDTVKTEEGCWFDNALIMDDLAGQCDDDVNVGCDGVIATYDACYGLNVQIICASHDFVQKILKLILLDDTELDDGEIIKKLKADIKSPDAKNLLHEKRKTKSLLEYVGRLKFDK